MDERNDLIEGKAHDNEKRDVDESAAVAPRQCAKLSDLLGLKIAEVRSFQYQVRLRARLSPTFARPQCIRP